MQLQITVKYDPMSQSCSVEGPLEDKGLCYMLLELGKDTVRTFHEERKSSKFILPVGTKVPLPPPPGQTPQ